jgi:predicted P-loop ATPase/GTPase
MELYEIVEAEYPETIILETNKQVSYFFDHINITPVFDQSSFSVISTPQDNIRQYWVEGTNQVYIDKRTGVLKRVLSAEEAADLLIGREFKQKEYRKIYYFLVFLLVIGGVFFLPEKSKRYEK